MKKQFFIGDDGQRMVRETITEYQASALVTTPCDGWQHTFSGEWMGSKDFAAKSLINTIWYELQGYKWTRGDISYATRQRERVRTPLIREMMEVELHPAQYEVGTQYRPVFGGWDLH